MYCFVVCCEYSLEVESVCRVNFRSADYLRVANKLRIHTDTFYFDMACIHHCPAYVPNNKNQDISDRGNDYLFVYCVHSYAAHQRYVYVYCKMCFAYYFARVQFAFHSVRFLSVLMFVQLNLNVQSL